MLSNMLVKMTRKRTTAFTNLASNALFCIENAESRFSTRNSMTQEHDTILESDDRTSNFHLKANP
jgi:hypothetical protein